MSRQMRKLFGVLCKKREEEGEEEQRWLSDIRLLDFGFPEGVQTFSPSMNINFEHNDQLRAIIHCQSNLVPCLRSLRKAAMTF